MIGHPLYRLVRILGDLKTSIGESSTDWQALYVERDRLNEPGRGEWPHVRYGLMATGEVEQPQVALETAA